jgi:hypothetical protein
MQRMSDSPPNLEIDQEADPAAHSPSEVDASDNLRIFRELGCLAAGIQVRPKHSPKQVDRGR